MSKSRRNPSSLELNAFHLRVCVSKVSSLLSLLCVGLFVSPVVCVQLPSSVLAVVGERVFAQPVPKELGCQKVGASFQENSVRTKTRVSGAVTPAALIGLQFSWCLFSWLLD